MAKVQINGEYFEWDRTKRPLSEAVALERAMKDHFTNFSQWEDALGSGSATAMCGLVWLIWRRNGREVPLEDILSGEVEIDREQLLFEPDEGETDPTIPPPEASSTTAASTSARSASSGSGRGRSASSR